MHCLRVSLPSRERGLKYTITRLDMNQRAVAPFAGAWIEILGLMRLLECLMSLPSRERGLKCLCIRTSIQGFIVAPFAGAWIEILYGKFLGLLESLSLPSRERGLKSLLDWLFPGRQGSLPSRERGLK